MADSTAEPSKTVESAETLFGDVCDVRVEKYEILDIIEEGGMGVVYKARQKFANRLVALKMIRAGYATPHLLTRFQLEIQAAAHLQHTHIVPIYDVGESLGRPYYAMEFMEEGSLADRCQGQPQPPKVAARLMQKLAHAMHYAHQNSIIHRDLKPSNILLACRPVLDPSITPSSGQKRTIQTTVKGRNGSSRTANSTISGYGLDDLVPKITDFGLAKSLDSECGETRSDQVIGTPSYMAPEQVPGPTRIFGPCNDIYSLGAVLYWLLTGVPPFRGVDLLDTLAQVRDQEPVPVRQLQPGVPADLETICLTCLQKEPARRYPSAEALADDLGRFLTERPIEARPASQLERLARWCRREPKVAALSSIIALSLIVLAIVSTTLMARAWRERDRAEANEQVALFNEDVARRGRYAAEMNLAQRALQDGQLSSAEEFLHRYEGAGRDSELRGFEWHHLDRLRHPELRAWPGKEVRRVAYCVDGYRVAAADGKQIRLWSAATGDMLITLEGHQEAITSLSFSPDGKFLASGGLDYAVRIWEVQSGRVKHTLRGHRSLINDVAFSHDSAWLASVSSDETLRIWNTTTGACRILGGQSGVLTAVAFNADSTRVVAADRSGSLHFWKVATGEAGPVVPAEQGALTSIALSADGKYLASAGAAPTVRIWDARSGLPIKTLSLHTGRVNCVTFSPVGNRLASASDDTTICLSDLNNVESTQVFRAHLGGVVSCAFSPDGRRLLSADRAAVVKLWDLTTVPGLSRLRGHTAPVRAVAVGRGGKLIASGDDEGRIRIWDSQTGLVLPFRLTVPGAVFTLAWSPDGRRLAAAGKDPVVRVWDVDTGREEAKLVGHKDVVCQIVFNSAGRLLASASLDHTARIWNVASGQPLQLLDAGATPLIAAAFSQDGSTLACGAEDGSIRFGDPATGRWIRVLPAHKGAVYAVAYAPTGPTFASAGEDNRVRFWDLDHSRELPFTCTHRDWVRNLAFSADGRRLVAASSDGAVKLWDTVTGQEIIVLGPPSPSGEEGSMAFSPDEQYVVGGRKDGSLMVWEANPLSGALAERREALALLRTIVSEDILAADLVPRLRADRSISEGVRGQALSLLQSYSAQSAEYEATRHVAALFAQHGLREDVLNALRADKTMSGERRSHGLAVAAAYPQSSEQLRGMAWPIVARPGADPTRYRQALRWATAARQLAPATSKGVYLRLEGMAKYRVGAYQDALALLNESDRVNSAASSGHHPADLAFLAMAQKQLGLDQAARQTFSRLEESLRRADFRDGLEWRILFREAESILQPGSGDKSK
jgi:WD40 repeat protein/serine/threonine protein kinase